MPSGYDAVDIGRIIEITVGGRQPVPAACLVTVAMPACFNVKLIERQ